MLVKCDKLILNPINASTIRVSGGTETVIEHVYKDKIISIETPKNDIIAIGDHITIKNVPYLINIIKKKFINNVKVYELYTALRNKSSIFIMPMLNGHRHLFFWNRLFINCFVGTENDKDCICLLYRFSNDPLFSKFEKALKQFKSFRKIYDPGPYHTMFIFNIPAPHKENYQNFLKGKYSKFNNHYKLKILEFHQYEIDGVTGQILFKSPKRRKTMEKDLNISLPKNSELYSAPEMLDEIFNPKKYI